MGRSKLASLTHWCWGRTAVMHRTDGRMAGLARTDRPQSCRLVRLPWSPTVCQEQWTVQSILHIKALQKLPYAQSISKANLVTLKPLQGWRRSAAGEQQHHLVICRPEDQKGCQKHVYPWKTSSSPMVLPASR